MSFPSNWPDRPMSAALTLGGKKLGKQWSACCPAHDDKSPSLIIFEGRTSAVRVRCMADCEPIEIIAEIRWHEVADRLSMMHRDGWAESCFKFRGVRLVRLERGYTDKPEIDRISGIRRAMTSPRRGRRIGHDQADPSPAPGQRSVRHAVLEPAVHRHRRFLCRRHARRVFIDGRQDRAGHPEHSPRRRRGAEPRTSARRSHRDIRHAVTRNGSGAAASILGAVADRLPTISEFPGPK